MTKVELYKSRTFVVTARVLAILGPIVGITKLLKASHYEGLVCLFLQAIYFTVALINDFIGTNEANPRKSPPIRKVKDYIFSSLAFPVSFNVGISFWGLYAVDRELVFPRVLDAVFPVWLNHVVHTNVMVFMLLELFISFRQYPSRGKCLFGLITFMISYLAWLHVVKHYSGIWVYPVLEVLPLPMRIVFFAGAIGATVAFYFVGELLNKKIWAKEIRLGHRKSN
ncbi:hypothetical protein ACFFRR_005161 [Megaselia abdita]